MLRSFALQSTQTTRCKKLVDTFAHHRYRHHPSTYQMDDGLVVIRRSSQPLQINLRQFLYPVLYQLKFSANLFLRLRSHYWLLQYQVSSCRHKTICEKQKTPICDPLISQLTRDSVAENNLQCGIRTSVLSCSIPAA